MSCRALTAFLLLAASLVMMPQILPAQNTLSSKDSLQPDSHFNQSLGYALSKDSMVNVHASNKRVYHTVRTDHKPKIDGLLDDVCWMNDGYWQGGFVQQKPHQAGAPSDETEIKILYDNENIYMAIKCYNATPDGITAVLGRRDDLVNTDIAGIALDTYHDKQTAFEFNVTAAGQKIDIMHLGAYLWDFNWNSVWEGKSHVEDSLWTVEMLVPFSQLRFSDEKKQAWGMHVWRWIARLGEEDQWKLIPVDAPAMVYIFGELEGISDIPKKRHFELMPYVSARHTTGAGNGLGAGLDGKAALSSNFTLDYTVFPDFGQVEADPSNLNLTSYEVFFQERRPFFLEGNAIMDYASGEDLLFYSRRIGQAPSVSPLLGPNQTMTQPSATSIINALKVTGKTRNGFSLGIVNSMTQKEFAEIRDGDHKSKYAVEPFTNYFVARAKQDFNGGNSVVGGVLTSVTRSLQDEQLKDYLPARSFTGGLDLLHTWQNRKYFLSFKGFSSNLSGSEASISRIQQLPIHLFQRTDAPHLDVDQSATVLSGWGGDLQGGKQSGKFRMSGGLSWRSPGLDLNDVGYLLEADVISEKTALKYWVNKPAGILQSYILTLEQRHNWSFGGENTLDLVKSQGELVFMNLWQLKANLAHGFNMLDTRQLRGGPALRKDPFSMAGFLLSTNSALRFSAGAGLDKFWSDNRLSEFTTYTLNFRMRFSDRFIVNSSSVYEKVVDNNQFVPSPSLNIAGRIDRKTFYTTLRVEYFLTPELSFQYYGSPYSSVGKFTDIYKVADAHAFDPGKRYARLTYVNSDSEYQYYRENDQNNTVWKINPPDFNFLEFRSNFVLRWEYKAGSTFFFVWAHNRLKNENQYNPHVLEGWKHFGQLDARNTLMVKFSYWFSL